jgi:hypothetical protein
MFLSDKIKPRIKATIADKLSTKLHIPEIK